MDVNSSIYTKYLTQQIVMTFKLFKMAQCYTKIQAKKI